MLINRGLDKDVREIYIIYIHTSIHPFSRSVVSDSLQPHESQHARPPCLSPTPGVHSNSSPSSRWCHPAISPSVIPFSSYPQSFPASESFPMSQLFAWGGQSTGVSALASFLPKKSQDGSPSEWSGWISLQSKGLSRVFSNTTAQKHQFFGIQLSSCLGISNLKTNQDEQTISLLFLALWLNPYFSSPLTSGCLWSFCSPSLSDTLQYRAYPSHHSELTNNLDVTVSNRDIYFHKFWYLSAESGHRQLFLPSLNILC